MLTNDIGNGLLVMILLTGAAGCGGGEAAAPPPRPMPPPDVVPADDGDIDSLSEGTEAEVPAEPVEATISVRVGIDEVVLPVQLLGADGEVVAETRAGETITIAPGSYTAVSRIEDDGMLIDKPERQEEIEVQAGQRNRIEVRFPRSRVRLQISRGGRAISNATVVLYRVGEEEPVARFTASDRAIPISPGRYEAEVTGRGVQTRVQGLVFQPNAQQDIPVVIE